MVPGSDGGISSDQEAVSLAQSIGFPVLIKAAAGGGGRGMKVAHAPEELATALRLLPAQGFIGGAMQPPPAGQWGMPREMLDKLPGYGPDVVVFL